MIFDAHIHVLPNVDDGSYNMKMSLDMIKTAYIQGVRKMCATSHSYTYTTENYANNLKKYDDLVKQINQMYPDMKLYLGCEIYCESFYMEDILKKLKNKIIPSYNNSSYILIEFDPYEKFESVLYCVEQLINEKLKPIIAHTERYLFSTDINNVKALKELGALVQINMYSIKDEKDYRIKNCVNELLNQYLVDVVGSDAHRTNHRPPNYITGELELRQKYEPFYVNDILWYNMNKIIEDKEV